MVIHRNGTIDVIHSNLQEKCEANEWSINIVRNWMNRGKIRKTTHKDRTMKTKNKQKIANMQFWDLSKIKTWEA